MKSVKNFVLILTFVLFTVGSICFAEGLSQNIAGDWTYETTISSLVNRRVYEEIRLINNSSYSLSHITCTVTINGKNHDMKPIPVLNLSDSEGFDGYYKDDMNREFPRYFGKDGKFSKRNDNIVKFVFKFGNHAEDIVITGVYDREEDLCFVIQDSDPSYETNRPASYVSEPEVVMPVSKPAKITPKSDASGDTTVVIDGKNYLIHDGKAYLIQ